LTSLLSSTHPSTTELYTLSLHDALPILVGHHDDRGAGDRDRQEGRHLEESVRDGVVHQVPRERAQGCADETGVESPPRTDSSRRSEEHTSELQSRGHLVCRLLLEKKKKK